MKKGKGFWMVRESFTPYSFNCNKFQPELFDNLITYIGTLRGSKLFHSLDQKLELTMEEL